MKSLLLFVSLTLSLGAFAATKTWTKTKSGGQADYPCLYAAGGLASASAIESELVSKCYSAGYDTCETVHSSCTTTDSGSDMFCGYWSRNKCTVVVRGTK